MLDVELVRQTMDEILDICHQNMKNLGCFNVNLLMWFLTNAAENLENHLIMIKIVQK